MDDFITAREAAEMLGVKLDTLYVYVSRKHIRSVPSKDKSKHLYWRADVERTRRKASVREPASESALTLYTAEDLFYRGRSVRELTGEASFEAVASLLWDAPPKGTFTGRLPAVPPSALALSRSLAAEPAPTRAMCLFPLLEAANPKSLDLSPAGMARSGADVLRMLCAITLGREQPVEEPIHQAFAATLGLSAEQADLVRRLLILSADHGLESATYAVRAVASTGVSPWRAVATGLSVMSGRRSRIGHFGRVERVVAEVIDSPDPCAPIVRRVQEGEEVPGFQDAGLFAIDARARILRERLHATMPDDAEFKKIAAAAAVMLDITGREPTFPYLSTFAWRKLGLISHQGPFMLGRSAGWIGHAIEQYQAGERERVELHYRGPLPAPDDGGRADDGTS